MRCSVQYKHALTLNADTKPFSTLNFMMMVVQYNQWRLVLGDIENMRTIYSTLNIAILRYIIDFTVEVKYTNFKQNRVAM